MNAREIIAKVWEAWDARDGELSWSDCLRGADDVLAALKEAGYAVVPVVPTPKMLTDVGTIEGYDEDVSVSMAGADADHIAWWSAMLAAAQEQEEG